MGDEGGRGGVELYGCGVVPNLPAHLAKEFDAPILLVKFGMEG